MNIAQATEAMREAGKAMDRALEACPHVGYDTYGSQPCCQSYAQAKQAFDDAYEAAFTIASKG